ncbi:hypothetical protein AgCh_007978 [Apium graveolens]
MTLDDEFEKLFGDRDESWTSDSLTKPYVGQVFVVLMMPSVVTLRKRAETDMNDKSVKDFVIPCFKTALLAYGFSIDDPNVFVARIYIMLKLGLSIEDDEVTLKDTDMPALEEDATEGSKMEKVD